MCTVAAASFDGRRQSLNSLLGTLRLGDAVGTKRLMHRLRISEKRIDESAHLFDSVLDVAREFDAFFFAGAAPAISRFRLPANQELRIARYRPQRFFQIVAGGPGELFQVRVGALQLLDFFPKLFVDRVQLLTVIGEEQKVRRLAGSAGIESGAVARGDGPFRFVTALAKKFGDPRSFVLQVFGDEEFKKAWRHGNSCDDERNFSQGECTFYRAPIDLDGLLQRLRFESQDRSAAARFLHALAGRGDGFLDRFSAHFHAAPTE